MWSFYVIIQKPPINLLKHDQVTQTIHVVHIQCRTPATKVTHQIMGKLKICFVPLFPMSKELAVRRLIHTRHYSRSLCIATTVNCGQRGRSLLSVPSQHALNQPSPSPTSFSLHLGTKRKLLKISRELSLPRADSSFHEMSHNLPSLIKLSLSLSESSLALCVCCLIFPMPMLCQILLAVT